MTKLGRSGFGPGHRVPASKDNSRRLVVAPEGAAEQIPDTNSIDVKRSVLCTTMIQIDE